MGKTAGIAGIALGLFLSACGCSYDKISPVSEITTELRKEAGRKSYEEILFEDARDGRLDMNFLDAVFIASGCEDAVVEYYRKELDKFALEIAENASARGVNETEKARQICSEIRNKTFYRYLEHRIHYLANSGIRWGNCFGLSILFNLACERAGIQSGVICNFSHAFNYAKINGKLIYFDATMEDLTPEEEHIQNEFSYEPSRLDIISQIYCLRGAGLSNAGKVEEARKEYEKALRVFPKNKHNLENLVRINEGFDDERALEAMNRYVSEYPKLSSLHIYKARILLRMGKYEDAVSSLKDAGKIEKNEDIEKWINEIKEEHLGK